MAKILVLGNRAAEWAAPLEEAGLSLDLCPVREAAVAGSLDPVCVLMVWAAREAGLAEICRATRASQGLEPLFSLAVADAESDADTALAASADAVVPPWRGAVVAAVERALEQSGQRHELFDANARIARLMDQAKHRDTFFDMSLDMLCIADFQGYFQHLNPAWAVLGWSFEELRSRPFLEFVHPDDVGPTLEVMSKLTTTDYSTISFENRYRCKDGDHKWLLWSARTSHGAVRAEDRLYYSVARDITERKRREEALRHESEKLSRSNADLEQFAHIASHDLQEPLRMVSSYVRLLEKRYKGQLDEQADKYIHYAVDGAQRMHALINDLLSYSRVGSDMTALDVVDVDPVLERVVTDMSESLNEVGATVNRDTMPRVRGHAGQIRQVFQNLIGNAIKFNRAGEPPRVSITATRGELGNEWHFAVGDNGIGIDPESFGRIFELFQRLHGRGEYTGTGLGLAIAKRVVERHGGRIWLESEVGTGTTFHFTLQGTGT